MSNLAKLMSRSGDLVRQGDLAGARKQLEKAVRDHRASPEPWISLAAVHGMGGDYPEALRCAQKAVKLAPNSLNGWINLANAAQSCGDIAQSAEAFQRARALPGCPPDITLNLGLALAGLGEWAKADEALGAYCARHPGHREATLTRGKALARQRNFQAAIDLVGGYSSRHPEDMPALIQLGMIQLQSGQIENAWRTCDQAMESAPDNTDVLMLKAALLMFEGRYEEARETYELLLQKRSRPEPRLYILVSQACRHTGDTDASIAYTRTALELEPLSIPALTTLSSMLLKTDPAEARALMEKAVAIAPNDPSVLVQKGRVLELEGDKEGAWEAVRTAIEAGSIDSDAAADAAAVAAEIAPATGNSEEVIELLEKIIRRDGISTGDQRTLRFTLTRLCDKAKQYDRAFEHADIANRLKNAWFDRDGYRVEMDRLKAVYSKTTVDSLPRSGNQSELPVFIVGMPRSGTSLLEQILSCHSQVHARGETQEIGDIVAKIPYYPDGVRNLSREKLDALAGEHLQHLHETAPSASRITEKMPGNYKYIGIISQLFPGARIINCRRDPRSVCLSNYMIEFGRGLTYSYDLENLAHACREYQDLVQHWKTVLPIPVLDVRYEELVADPRTWVKKILDFCGLEWEDACLDFHKSKRQVITASYDQVRQPLYSSSVARWKHYERQLEPVSRILNLHDDTYP